MDGWSHSAEQQRTRKCSGVCLSSSEFQGNNLCAITQRTYNIQEIYLFGLDSFCWQDDVPPPTSIVVGLFGSKYRCPANGEKGVVVVPFAHSAYGERERC